ncbi:hypothetical protein E2562_012357 [Oryza meyeriana var. granulata]|uniref:Uncharacterized protein n=1 Tax=Oryza meyeriana var. granulata TaxID=110450 RepID=A0A6G1DHH6_9ORYZ|nr:hypothetical protein E2562_012357 [Oryza meyeriana var. granulata]
MAAVGRFMVFLRETVEVAKNACRLAVRIQQAVAAASGRGSDAAAPSEACKKACVGQIGIKEVRGNVEAVSSEEVKASGDDAVMDISGYAQDPYDDSNLEDILQDPEAFKKSVMNFLDLLKSDSSHCLKRTKFA